MLLENIKLRLTMADCWAVQLDKVGEVPQNISSNLPESQFYPFPAFNGQRQNLQCNGNKEDKDTTENNNKDLEKKSVNGNFEGKKSKS